MLENILKEVEKKHVSSGGHCGLSTIQLTENMNVTYGDIKELLNKMHSDKLIRVRNGINSYLLFKAV